MHNFVAHKSSKHFSQLKTKWLYFCLCGLLLTLNWLRALFTNDWIHWNTGSVFHFPEENAFGRTTRFFHSAAKRYAFGMSLALGRGEIKELFSWFLSFFPSPPPFSSFFFVGSTCYQRERLIKARSVNHTSANDSFKCSAHAIVVFFICVCSGVESV